jgi:hypothetical protein
MVEHIYRNHQLIEMMVLKHQEKNHHLVYHPYHHLQDYMLLVLVLEIEQRDEEQSFDQ